MVVSFAELRPEDLRAFRNCCFHLFAEGSGLLDINCNNRFGPAVISLGRHVHADIACAYDDDLLVFQVRELPILIPFRKS